MTNTGPHFGILLGGDLHVTPRLGAQIADARFIAADGGMKHAHALAVQPELWLGDFDSTDPALAALYADVPRQSFPVAKDMTDGALAIAEAQRRGAGRISLLGAFGGNFDHAVSHGLQLVGLAERKITCMMTSGFEEAHPLLDALVLTGLSAATRLSVLGLTPLRGLSITGVRWPLHEVDVVMGSTWTLSNETQGDVALNLREGRALVVVSHAKGQK